MTSRSKIIELTNRRIGKDNCHGFNETQKQCNHNLKLAQSDIIIVKTGQKKYMLSADDIPRGESADFNVIWEAIRRINREQTIRQTLGADPDAPVPSGNFAHVVG